jgi:periplasmic protein TonB
LAQTLLDDCSRPHHSTPLRRLAGINIIGGWFKQNAPLLPYLTPLRSQHELRSSSRKGTRSHHHMHTKRHARLKEAQIEGWLISLLLHGVIVVFGLLLVKRTHLPPQPEPFRWTISLVSPLELDSPTAALPDKAPPTESPTELPPVVTAPPSTAFSPTESHDTPAAEPGNRKSAAAMLREASSISTTADKLYQIVGPDGSISFTNVPSDSHFYERKIDSSRLSTVDSTAALASTEKAGISPRPSPSVPTNDYHWLWETLLRRMVEETNGEVCYRTDPVEGRVVMKMAIDHGGRISEVQVVQSSGHAILDQITIDIMRQISPVSLPRLLEKPLVTLQFPMTYRLHRQSQALTWCARING